jgi:hypothetical protein
MLKERILTRKNGGRGCQGEVEERQSALEESLFVSKESEGHVNADQGKAICPGGKSFCVQGK